MQLGTPIPAFKNREKCAPQCQHTIGSEGSYHALKYKWGGGAIRRHDNVLDWCYKMLRSVDFGVKKNQLVSSKGSIDLLLQPITFKMETVIHPWAQSNISGSSKTTGYTAEEVQQAKNNRYLQKSTGLGYLFRPIGIEVFGRWATTAEELLKQVTFLVPQSSGYHPVS